MITTALAAGGLTALSACLEEAGVAEIPQGSATTVPERQFAWNEYLSRDSFGNTIFPIHQLVLLFDYTGSIPPSAAEREAVAGAFDTIDRAIQRGNGGDGPYSPGGDVMDGLLYTFGYSARYFDRFDESLPDDLNFYDAETLLEKTEETEPEADQYDAAMVLASDHAQLLLAIEMALQGKLDSLNGEEMAGSFDGIFEVAERRSAFMGPNITHKKLDNPNIPESSPMAMGFVSGFADNQAPESRVAIPDGPFAEGSLQQISQLTLDLDDWYELNHEDRIELMFSPSHSEEDVGEVGQFLASDSGLTVEMGEQLNQDAEELGRVGHTQKLADTRDEDFNPKILRRSEALSTGSPNPGMNFTSLQRDLDDFVEVRQAMDGEFVDEELPEEESGILHYHAVERRGTYLVPPRSHIALPTPLGET